MTLVFFYGCRVINDGNITYRSSTSSASQASTATALANAIYRLDEFDSFQLVDGEYRHQYGKGLTQVRKIKVEKIALGDLDNDAVSDACVILASQSGGSGTFKYLVAMRDTGNAFIQQDAILLGDRSNISAMTITGGRVNIEMVAAGSKDPACCPSQKLKLSYVLIDGKWLKTGLVNSEQSDETSHSTINMTGIVWKLKRFDDTSDSGNFVIDDPNRYTLILLANGQYRVKAGCNRMQGAYTLDGNHIKIAPGAATLAECAPGSRYAEYLRYLTEAVSFDVNENTLQLNLVTGKGKLVFENGGAVSDKPDPIQK